MLLSNKDKMLEISNGYYVPLSKIVYIFNNTIVNTTMKKIRKSAKTNKLDLILSAQPALSLVILDDNTVIFCPKKASKLKEDAYNLGLRFISVVDPEIYISVQHILAISDCNNYVAVDYLQESKMAGNDLQFIRLSEKEKV